MAQIPHQRATNMQAIRAGILRLTDSVATLSRRIDAWLMAVSEADRNESQRDRPGD